MYSKRKNDEKLIVFSVLLAWKINSVWPQRPWPVSAPSSELAWHSCPVPVQLAVLHAPSLSSLQLRRNHRTIGCRHSPCSPKGGVNMETKPWCSTQIINCYLKNGSLSFSSFFLTSPQTSPVPLFLQGLVMMAPPFLLEELLVLLVLVLPPPSLAPLWSFLWKAVQQPPRLCESSGIPWLYCNTPREETSTQLGLHVFRMPGQANKFQNSSRK